MKQTRAGFSKGANLIIKKYFDKKKALKIVPDPNNIYHLEAHQLPF